MAMTRKDYRQIAERLGEQLGYAQHMAYGGGSENVALWRNQVKRHNSSIYHCAKALEFNDNFDYDRFIDWALAHSETVRKMLWQKGAS